MHSNAHRVKEMCAAAAMNAPVSCCVLQTFVHIICLSCVDQPYSEAMFVECYQLVSLYVVPLPCDL